MNDMINKSEFILGVDGGGTKTIARLENLHTGQQWLATGGSASLTNDFDLALQHCKALVAELCAQANCSSTDVTAVFGLAGAGNKEKATEFKCSVVADYKNVNIYTDAKTSLYGANEGNPVVVVSLGTGSVGAVLTADGKEIQIGGWGFNVGDEGSGAKMGVLAIRAVLSELEDLGHVESILAQAIVSKLGGDQNNVLAWSTSAKPSDFASLTPLVFEHHDKCCVARNILMEHVGHVENLIDKTRSNYQLPVILLGGLSIPTLPFLNSRIKSMLVEAKGNALDGACLLAKKLTQIQITGCVIHGN
ncbi:BadF/BadG/BcrA/BcrD ATPase family protein [Colwellia sp. 1_MG-2023]|jgi:glucosamine kinase|uniref:BadF/BadG/BcrA/BcrD ATPase family protein n=1 Tax=unclassified Colwellia TaxID=196834 RepID=UPI001C09F5B2|nr:MULTISPECIES: BadF/BadG/BcrA/BcrD ATPase family protein [unclassified Colwellia]MBU2923139.1 ATPase [Colwellia sp. C2M11]MDO6651432.1 BadF/BadG/BcrA/BcrD ATPase family protein [Colwellia sp. 3_MG-2023]MDO6664145.1 BadF/BadG/BcrA/BcrD ATPase family protein [Colwellia sp. 2_MG-2023]MDO6688741.1 BadF/BadG/BcrA/BcrD ATPase family protein [Colwellia sp. 1_MG-2023]